MRSMPESDSCAPLGAAKLKGWAFGFILKNLDHNVLILSFAQTACAVYQLCPLPSTISIHYSTNQVAIHTAMQTVQLLPWKIRPSISHILHDMLDGPIMRALSVHQHFVIQCVCWTTRRFPIWQKRSKTHAPVTLASPGMDWRISRGPSEKCLPSARKSLTKGTLCSLPSRRPCSICSSKYRLR